MVNPTSAGAVAATAFARDLPRSVQAVYACHTGRAVTVYVVVNEPDATLEHEIYATELKYREEYPYLDWNFQVRFSWGNGTLAAVPGDCERIR